MQDKATLPHGTLTQYVDYGCRCPHCRNAASAYFTDYYHKNREKAVARTPPKHGTVTAYNNYGRRCEECREAKSEYNRQYRKAK